VLSVIVFAAYLVIMNLNSRIKSKDNIIHEL